MLDTLYSKSKLFYFSSIIFLTAVLVSSFFDDYLNQRDVFIFFIISFLIISLTLFWDKRKTRIILIMFIFLFLGIWRFSISIHNVGEKEVASLNESTNVVVGVIKNNPESSLINQQYIVKVDSIEDKEYSGNLLVYASLYPIFSYGDKVQLKCKLKKPEKIENFSYDKYLAMKNIFSICYYPETTFLSSGEGNAMLAKIYKFKNRFKDSVNKNIGEPGSSIINAMVLGDKRFISEELKLKFSKTGISHIIAISGMHIAVFVLGVGYFLFFIGINRNWSFYLIVIILIFYNILIGFPASSLRASFMAALVLYAFKIGRLNKIINSIILAAFCIVLVNPMVIRYDMGFIFSFLALLGIVAFYKLFELKYRNIQNKILKYSLNIINVSISAQILILPFILINFGVLSLISPIVNLLVIWTLPFFLAGTIISYFLSLILPFISDMVFIPVKLIINYLLLVVDISLKVPFSNFLIDFSENSSLRNWGVVFYYLFFLIYYFSAKIKGAKLVDPRE